MRAIATKDNPVLVLQNLTGRPLVLGPLKIPGSPSPNTPLGPPNLDQRTCLLVNASSVRTGGYAYEMAALVGAKRLRVRMSTQLSEFRVPTFSVKPGLLRVMSVESILDFFKGVSAPAKATVAAAVAPVPTAVPAAPVAEDEPEAVEELVTADTEEAAEEAAASVDLEPPETVSTEDATESGDDGLDLTDTPWNDLKELATSLNISTGRKSRATLEAEIKAELAK